MLRDYLELSKARIVLMVLVTTAAGYLVALPRIAPGAFLQVLLGTALVAAGANGLNQYVEREHDARMRRTRLRPLPDGRITPAAALRFSVAVALAGTLYLGLTVNWLTALLGALTLISYIFVYTPLKRVSTACTIIGAIPGAIPPLMGATAATGQLTTTGWICFAILFIWQLPHFMAISWIYREDYGRGGFVMSSGLGDGGTSVARQAVLFSVVLLGVSLLPSLTCAIGAGYLAAATVCGLALLMMAIAFLYDRTHRAAKRLFLASNVYLIVLMTTLVAAVRT